MDNILQKMKTVWNIFNGGSHFLGRRTEESIWEDKDKEEHAKERKKQRKKINLHL